MPATRDSPAGRADPHFPWLSEDQWYAFPKVGPSSFHGIVCTGGNLSPGMILSAYRQGIFPWFNDDDPIVWHSPDPRFILEPRELHVSDTMRKIIKKRRFELSLDTSFSEVIHACSSVPRRGQSGTWITADMVEAYERLHELGYAHSVEARLDGRLAGGFYGISLGSAFFGESMFSLEPDASKAAFLPFVWYLADQSYTLVDSQVRTAHVESMGGKNVTKARYLKLLSEALLHPTRKGNWTQLFPDFPNSLRLQSLYESKRSGVS